MSQLPRHPMQPIVFDDKGVLRFKADNIVKEIIEQYPFDPVTNSEQFASDYQQILQLMGVTVDDYCSMPYVSKRSKHKARKKAAELLKESENKQQFDKFKGE